MQSRIFQRLNPGRKVRHLENHPIPAARLLGVAIRHRARTRRAGATQNQFEIAGRNLGKSRQMLLIQLETKLLSVEVDGPTNVLYLIAHTPQPENEAGAL